MEEIVHVFIVVVLYVLYIILIPVIMILATPFILLWPGKKLADGRKEPKQIKKRYARIWKIWENTGLGLPTS